MLNVLAPNQKAIRILKSPADKDHLYSLFNLSATKNALKSLSPNTFKLWAYLNLNADGYEFGLSRKDTMEICGFGSNTFTSAVNELIEKGFLVKAELYPRLIGYLFMDCGLGEKVDLTEGENGESIEQ